MEMVKIKDEYGGRLPRPFSFLWDEFGVSPAVPGMEEKFNTCRSMGMRLTIAFQDYAQLKKQYGPNDEQAIESALANTIFIYSNSTETQKKISEMCGEKLVWNKKKGDYDVVPTITVDRLANYLQLSESVIIRKRRMPYITRYYDWKRYNFTKHLSTKQRELKDHSRLFRIFSLTREFDKLKKLSDINKIMAVASVKEVEKSKQETDKKEIAIEVTEEKTVITKIPNLERFE